MLQVFSNARFVDVERGQYYPHGTRLLVAGEHITALLAPTDPDPGDARPVDLGGRAAIPALFNTHCHLQLTFPSPLAVPGDLLKVRRFGPRQVVKNLADCRQRGVLHLRDALQGDQRPNQALAQRIARGELPGPRLHQAVLVAPQNGAFSQPHTLFDRFMAFLSGSSLLADDDPASGVVKVSPTAGPAEVCAAVDRAIDHHGAQSIKIYDQAELIPLYTPGANVFAAAQVAAAAGQARRRGVPCTMHHTTVEGFRRGVQAGVTSLAHLPCDALLAEADLAAARASGLILEPTLSVAYFMAWSLPAAAWLDHPLYRRLAAEREAGYTGLVNAFWLPELGASTLALPEKVHRGQFRMLGLVDMSAALRYWGRMASVGFENLQRLHAAGVPIACGTDAGAVPISQAAVGLELRLLGLLLPGFGPAEVLRAATLTAAQTLGLHDRFGALAPGRVADLVLLAGDPLADSTLIGAPVQGLFVAGQPANPGL